MPPLRTSLYKPWPVVDQKEVVLELPACERAKTIALRLKHHWRLRLRLRLQPADVFTALTGLIVPSLPAWKAARSQPSCARVAHVRNLRLYYIKLVDASGISTRSASDTLRSLSFCVRKTRRLP
ncbi:unnamed protein product [Urochloa humidicola]